MAKKEAKIANLEKRNASLAGKLQSQEKKNCQFSQSIDDLRQRLEKVQAKAQDDTCSATELIRDQKLQYVSDMTAKDGMLERKSNELSCVQQSLSETLSHVSRLQSEVERSNLRFEKADRNNQELASKVDKQQQSVDRLIEVEATLKDQLTQFRDEVEQLERTGRDTEERLSHQVRLLDAALSNAQEEHVREMQARNAQFENIKRNSENRLNALKSALENENNAYQAAVADIADLQRDKDVLLREFSKARELNRKL